MAFVQKAEKAAEGKFYSRRDSDLLEEDAAKRSERRLESVQVTAEPGTVA